LIPCCIFPRVPESLTVANASRESMDSFGFKQDTFTDHPPGVDPMLHIPHIPERLMLANAHILSHPQDSQGSTALHLALATVSESEILPFVQSLLAAKADPLARNDAEHTPLHVL